MIIYFNTYCQDVKCNELINIIKTEGDFQNRVNNYNLTESSWLEEVESYSYKNKLFILAQLNKKKYIFCRVPSSNWKKFKSTITDSSYGEKFHKYIMNFKCECS